MKARCFVNAFQKRQTISFFLFAVSVRYAHNEIRLRNFGGVVFAPSFVDRSSATSRQLSVSGGEVNGERLGKLL